MPIGGDAPAEPASEEAPRPSRAEVQDEAASPTTSRSSARRPTSAPYEDGDSGEASRGRACEAARTTDEEDLLSESPDFVEEENEDEDLWFEKGPPKDFDFEDEK